MDFALWEQVLLGGLIIVTLALAAREVSPKLRFVLAGAPERVRTDQLGNRLTRVVREVLLQSRVIGGRPVVGSLHAVVFAGFLCFAFETTDHFLEPFGVHFLGSLLGSALPIFKDALAIIAVLVMIGVSGLAYRRFIMVKISPDPRSWTSGLVALMIFLLMSSYLYGLDEEAAGQKLNWWLHALLILGFVPLILHSKHFHILAGPVNVFLRNHRLGDFLPMDLEAISEAEEEVSLGLEQLADLPWKMRLDFLTCVECRRCTDQCPAAGSGQELNPREFVLAGRAMMGRTEGPIIGNVISATALGQCTSCGACENICPVGIEHTQLLLGAKRAQAMAIGQGMVADDFLQKIERKGNPFAASRNVRKTLIEEVGIPIFETGTTEYLLWLGCAWTYNEESRSSVESLVLLLNAAGVSYGVLEEESCSGHHSRRQGEEFQFQTLAAENMERFSAGNVKKILSACPHCLHTFHHEYPDLDQQFSVDTIHHSQLLAELVSTGQLGLGDRPGDSRKITYHDPCYLGRYEGVYDAPRDIIASTGQTFTELPRHGPRSFCCGGGAAGFLRTQETGGTRVDQVRKQEIADSGADLLVTGCPECKMMLNSAVEETLDIAELLADRCATPAP
jgi:Fe-S oxidoreductase